MGCAPLPHTKPAKLRASCPLLHSRRSPALTACTPCTHFRACPQLSLFAHNKEATNTQTPGPTHRVYPCTHSLSFLRSSLTLQRARSASTTLYSATRCGPLSGEGVRATSACGEANAGRRASARGQNTPAHVGLGGCALTSRTAVFGPWRPCVVKVRAACCAQLLRGVVMGWGGWTHVRALLADEGVEHLVDAPQAGEDGAADVQAGQRAGAVPDGALDLQAEGEWEVGKDGSAATSPGRGRVLQAGVALSKCCSYRQAEDKGVPCGLADVRSWESAIRPPSSRHRTVVCCTHLLDEAAVVGVVLWDGEDV